MRRSSWLPVLLLFTIGFLSRFARAQTQTQTAIQPETEPQAHPGTRSVGTVDGGTREVLESIFVPPLSHAPFSLTLATEWTRPMGNSGSFTVANQRRIMRDSTGRIYEERWLLAPKNSSIKSTLSYIQIADPNQHTLYNCQIASRACFLLVYAGSATIAYHPRLLSTGTLPSGNGFTTHEELGHNEVAGIDTMGYRDTVTLNPGTFGNDQPMTTTREFWFSAQLGINLLSKVDSPRDGKQTFTVREITTTEPDPQPFELPEGFKVVDRRKSAPPEQ